jgi:hypothetical protein
MAAMAVLTMAACGGAPKPSSRSSAPPVDLSGTILGSRSFAQELFAYRLPGLQQERLDAGRHLVNGIGFGLDYLGAYWVDADHALTFSLDNEGRVGRLVEASRSGPSRRIGPPLKFVSSFDVRADWVMAATCARGTGSVQTLDLAHPTAWHEVGDSCIGTLSSDGRRVAFVRNDTEVWEAPVGGGAASLRADVATIPEARRFPSRSRRISALAWGDGGLAAVMGSGSRFDLGGGRAIIFTIDETGRTTVVPLPAEIMFLPRHPWQPHGDLLSLVSMPTSGGSVIRLFEPRTGKLRVVAADTQWFGNALWSPDGRTLVATTGSNAMLFVDATGRWITRIGTGGVGLLDWGA